MHTAGCRREARRLRSPQSTPPNPTHPVLPGSVLFLEIKHWKGDKRRFSTLAWSYAPLDRLVDFGQHAARVGACCAR